uniref:Transcriptional regulator, XRE family n=1 Tax=Candidatus Kentrum sp. LPFa TaxID=2126335 RepID=A0A450WHU6_9GAMM|nr:MAG: transcriptional regulator, XRE family [Candidatus Kentron sp. LPFa]
MSDLKTYISQRRAKDPAFEEGFEDGYQSFKIGVLLKKMRETSGFTQAQVAEKLHTQTSAVSRIENHAEDIRLSTLERFAAVFGRSLEVSIR